jgi:hypothetical protein
MVLNVQVSDTTGDDSHYIAGCIKKFVASPAGNDNRPVLAASSAQHH